MSCFYKALPTLIPQLILTAGANAEIGIVSPWIHNVLIRPPIFGSGRKRIDASELEFKNFLTRIVIDFGYRIIFVVRPGDGRTEDSIRKIVDAGGDRILIKRIEHTHAKMIVTPSFALETSANLIPTSLHRNIESCTLVPNRFLSTRKYLEAQLGINL